MGPAGPQAPLPAYLLPGRLLSVWLLPPACCILDLSMCSTYVCIICGEGRPGGVTPAASSEPPPPPRPRGAVASRRAGDEARAGRPPLCAAGAERCTPSSSPTPAPPTGKLENTTAVRHGTTRSSTAPHLLGLNRQRQRAPGQTDARCRLAAAGAPRQGHHEEAAPGPPGCRSPSVRGCAVHAVLREDPRFR